MNHPDPPDLDGTISWRQLEREAADRLAAAGVDSAAVDARRIVEEASGHEGAALVLALDEPATKRAVASFDRMVARRLTGEPLQYVLGRWGFRRLDVAVDARVLIPRPETEQVVEVALAELDRAPGTTVVDLGTGSGVIALSMAVERPGTDVWAVDRSTDALAVARANLAGHGRAAVRVRLLEGSWFEPLPADLQGAVSVVVANPPYVGADEVLPAEVVDWEPAGALVAGPTGLEDLEVIVAGAVRWLAPGGALVAEIGAAQGAAVQALARAAGLVDVVVVPDLAGRDRTLRARRPG